MITTVVIVAGAILSATAVIVFTLSVVHAPEGVENETGFHGAKKPRILRNRYSNRKLSRSTKSAKSRPLKEYIPAA